MVTAHLGVQLQLEDIPHQQNVENKEGIKVRVSSLRKNLVWMIGERTGVDQLKKTEKPLARKLGLLDAVQRQYDGGTLSFTRRSNDSSVAVSSYHRGIKEYPS